MATILLASILVVLIGILAVGIMLLFGMRLKWPRKSVYTKRGMQFIG